MVRCCLGCCSGRAQFLPEALAFFAYCRCSLLRLDVRGHMHARYTHILGSIRFQSNRFSRHLLPHAFMDCKLQLILRQYLDMPTAKHDCEGYNIALSYGIVRCGTSQLACSVSIYFLCSCRFALVSMHHSDPSGTSGGCVCVSM